MGDIKGFSMSIYVDEISRLNELTLPEHPIGIDEPRQGLGIKRRRAHRLEARNELARIKKEDELHRLANDRLYIQWIYDKMETCPDFRAQAMWAKVVGEFMRLGKREPTRDQPASQVNIQINLPEGDEARALLARFDGQKHSRIASQDDIKDSE